MVTQTVFWIGFAMLAMCSVALLVTAIRLRHMRNELTGAENQCYTLSRSELRNKERISDLEAQLAERLERLAEAEKARDLYKSNYDILHESIQKKAATKKPSRRSTKSSSPTKE